MLSRFAAGLLSLISLSSAAPHTLQKRIDNTQAVGTNPITSFRADFLGQQSSVNSCGWRDLGFGGSINGQWYAVYGDTTWCSPNTKNDTTQQPLSWQGMVRDTVVKMTSDPLEVEDVSVNSNDQPQQFVPWNAAWGETNQYGFGGTSLCEVDASTNTGLVFYLVNANAAGLKGAGVAKVVVQGDAPTVTERLGTNGWWWDPATNARYGDVAAYRDPNSDYIYAWGGAPTTVTSWPDNQYVYLARVKASGAFDLSQYEYFWGPSEGWKTNIPLSTFTSETAVHWATGQGQVVWSAYHKTYYFVNVENGGNCVYIRTAAKLEGPWTPMKEVYCHAALKAGDMMYAGIAQPHLDPSGKTLVVGYTFNVMATYMVRITFDP